MITRYVLESLLADNSLSYKTLNNELMYDLLSFYIFDGNHYEHCFPENVFSWTVEDVHEGVKTLLNAKELYTLKEVKISDYEFQALKKLLSGDEESKHLAISMIEKAHDSSKLVYIYCDTVYTLDECDFASENIYDLDFYSSQPFYKLCLTKIP